MKEIQKGVILSRRCSESRCINKAEVLSRNTSGRQLSRAFTLVELLVVVLIIGILSAIAIPMYQGAVDKSHWSTMLPGAKALKDAEEAIRMSNGLYTSNMDNLDVRMPSGDVQYTLETVNDDGTANVVHATNTKLPTVRLSNYLDENVNFGGQLHCEVKDGDERATRLCEKLLGGQYIMPVDGGYTAYLLDQEIDQATCNHAEQSWSTSKTKCYRTDEARCTALDMDVVSAGQCGYTNTQGQEIGAEGICKGNAYSNGSDRAWACGDSTVSAGGVCEALNRFACNNTIVKAGGMCLVSQGGYEACWGGTIEAGGTCQSNVGTHSCSAIPNVQGTVICNGNGGAGYCGYQDTFNGGICVGNGSANCIGSTFKNGAICYANNVNSCWKNGSVGASVFQDTSCCCGKFCPDSAPKCANSRCDPQYMK